MKRVNNNESGESIIVGNDVDFASPGNNNGSNNLFKKILFVVIAFIIALVLCLVYDIKAYARTIEACVTSETVNMRTGPGMKYPVYKVLEEGTVLDLINDQDPSGWYEVWEEETQTVYFVYGKYTRLEMINLDDWRK